MSRTVRARTCTTDRPRLVLDGPVGDAPPGRLQAHQPAQRRRDADGAAAVAAARHRHHAGRHRRGRSARRAPGAMFGVPGVAGRPVGQRLGGGHQAQLGRVRATDEHEPGLAQPNHLVAVAGVRVAGVTQHHHPQMHRITGARRPKILQQHRHTPERPIGQIGRIGRRQRLVVQLVDDRIQLAIAGLDPPDRRLGQLTRRDLPGPYQAGQADGVMGEILALVDHEALGANVSIIRRTSSPNG